MFNLRQSLNIFRSWLFGAPSLPTNAESKVSPAEEVESNDGWCLVGNIIEEHPHGEQHEIKRGSKHFSPGTKVYCLPPQWGDGYEKAVVIGLRRGSRSWVTVVMPTSQITNWRAKVVYKPSLLKRLHDGYRKERDAHSFNRQWKSKAEVESWVRHLLQQGTVK